MNKIIFLFSIVICANAQKIVNVDFYAMYFTYKKCFVSKSDIQEVMNYSKLTLRGITYSDSLIVGSLISSSCSRKIAKVEFSAKNFSKGLSQGVESYLIIYFNRKSKKVLNIVNDE